MQQISLTDYLKQQGVTTETSKEELSQLKQQYWKAYHKVYYQRRKLQHHRLTLRLTDEEYGRLQNHAQEHQDISFSAFIKESALAYLEKQYIPRDTEATNELVKSIRKIGRVINQVVQSLHRATKYRNSKKDSDDKTTLQKSGGEAYQGNHPTDKKQLEKLHREYGFLVKRVSDMEKEVQVFMASPPKKIGKVLVEILEKDPSKITAVRRLLDDIEQKGSKKKI